MIIAEVPADKVGKLAITYTGIGEVTDNGTFSYGNTEITLAEAESAWKAPLEKVFATVSGEESAPESVYVAPADPQARITEDGCYDTKKVHICSHQIAQTTVFIPLFPGTNCESDSPKAF